MAQAERSPDRSPRGDDLRSGVVDRYSALARATRSGQQIIDCDPGAFTQGGFAPPVTPTSAGCPRVRCGRAWAWHRRRPAWRSDRLNRGRRDLDDPDRHLPREHRQPQAAPSGWIRRRRHAPPDRLPARPLARRHSPGATQHHHRNRLTGRKPNAVVLIRYLSN